MHFSFKNLKLENLKSNWYFPISAGAFLSLTTGMGISYIVAILISFLIAIVFAAKNPPFLEKVNKSSLKLKIFSAMTAAGICLAEQNFMYTRALVSTKISNLSFILSIDIPKLVYYVSLVMAVVAFVFIYICVIWFWNKFIAVINECEFFDDLTRYEIAFYVVIFVIASAITTAVFLKTNAFCITAPECNVIYTSDSPIITGRWWTQIGGVIHPLFALFAAPFVGCPYFIARILGVPSHIQALMMNYVQIIILFAATYILAKTMNLTSYKRIIFFVISYCSYVYLLFTLAMEGYITYFFWLSLLLYALCNKPKLAPDLIIASTGSIITSIILMPFTSEHSLLKNFKNWFADMINIVRKFLALIIAFKGSAIFFNLRSNIIGMTTFTGQNLTWTDKIRQYTYFIYDCFFAPLTRINLVDSTFWANPSWQLQFIEDVSYIGIIIFIICTISAFLNREKKSSQLAFFWIIFSFFVLCIVGWGTAENGLILYSLYFGWAFFVLIFQLLEKIEEKLNIKFLIPLCCVASLYVLFAINIPAMQELIDFAIEYYPVAN